jgi:hypothetical protein
MPMRTIIACAVLSVLVPSFSGAHSLGVSLEAVDNGKLVDIGYDPPTLTAGASALFDISLRDPETKDIVDFHHIWVRMQKERQTMFATGVAFQPLGPTTLLYAFPHPGEYTLDVSYRTAEGDTIARASFPLIVEDQERGYAIWIAYALAAGLIASMLAVMMRRLMRPGHYNSKET